jgi:PAS domain S-box-containing protein
MNDLDEGKEKTMTILAVEDSPTQLESLKYVLEKSGFSVITAANGKDGLSAAKANASAIDLVITDIVMPEMDGYAFCKELRADGSLKHLPVVLLTALSDPSDVIKGLESGADNFICKPYEDRALLARIQNVLANQEIRKTARSELGIKVFFAGQHFMINADRLQILDLLLSTYENAVSRNNELVQARDELRRLNEGLESQVAERTADLRARIKEEECLFAISKLVAQPRDSLDESLAAAVPLIPSGWLYPQIARARIRFEEREFAPEDFKLTAWTQSAEIFIKERKIGTLELCYLEERPARDEGPFLQGERGLIVDIARQLGVMIHKIMTEERIEAISRFPEENPSPILRIGDDGRLMYANQSADLLLRYWECAVGGRLPETWTAAVTAAMASGERREVELQCGDRYYALDLCPIIAAGYLNAYGRDITGRKKAFDREQLAREVIELLNRPAQAELAISMILLSIKKAMDLGAVGIRLREGEDFPYYAANGFSEDFMAAERYLCRRDAMGDVLRDAGGEPVLECMCGIVLCGRTDPTLPFFTPGGSFWTNSTTRLLASTSEAERQSVTRNRCNSQGYESVALIPLIADRTIIGLLQLNDSRQDRFSLDSILFFESLSASIGVALKRKQSEEAQQGSELRYRRLFESAKDGILILDAETGMIVDVNPFLVDLLGYSKDEFLGKKVWELGFLKDAIPNQENFWELTEKGQVRYEDMPLRTQAGQQIDVEFVSNVYLVKDQKVIQCNIRDITERVRTEKESDGLREQLQVSQKMEAIGSLAGGIAHDFNNLLCVIMNYADFALEKAGDADGALKLNLQEIVKAADRAAALTHQLLAFSRKQVMQMVPMNLNRVAAGIEKMLRRIIGEDIDFIQKLSPDLGVIQADPGQIEQVLMNLAVNARDAMPEGGKLTIETSNEELEEPYAFRRKDLRPGPYVRLAVTDSGYGMDEKTKARIFEPFFTTKEKGKGTGLGLSTVYGIVKQSAGDISVYSELGQGTSLKIYFPRVYPADAAAPDDKEAARPSTGTETVLVVDDEAAVLALAERILGDAGYTALIAADADEALRACARHEGPIHLLLTDVVMPNMSGKTLARKIKALRPRIKTLYISGYTDDAIVHHGVLDAGTHFLGKPFTAADLTIKIREVLDAAEAGESRSDASAEDVAADVERLDYDALRALPRDLLGKLRQAVIAARLDGISGAIDEIAAAAPDAAALMRRMAGLFDYEGLRGILDRIEEKKNHV